MGKAGMFQIIANSLRSRLLSGEFGAGDRVPSENELALRHSVSRPTAARALQELVREGLLERRVGSGSYVVDRRPRGPAASHRTYGLLMPGLGGTEILDPISKAIARISQDHGAIAFWSDPTARVDAIAEIDRICQLYLYRGVQGVFFAPLESDPNRETENLRITRILKSAGIEVVLIDRDLVEFPGRSEFDLVGIDNFHAGFQIGQHLIDVGRRQTCFLARPHAPSTTDLRVAGAREAMRRAGIATGISWFESGAPTDDEFVRRLLDRHRPDAVICSNDLTAALLIQTFFRLGVSVPGDVAVVGFDDATHSRLLSVALTTMRQPIHGIALAAVRALSDRLDNPTLEPRQILLTAELIVRESSGAPHPTARPKSVARTDDPPERSERRVRRTRESGASRAKSV
jgi:DNA-binding LacI/PurR family transcriptional regulator